LVDSIDAILEELADKGFRKIDKKAVLRNISASAGGGFSAERASTRSVSIPLIS
jgi:hypothetical protein